MTIVLLSAVYFASQPYLLVNEVDDKYFVVTQCVWWRSLFVHQERRDSVSLTVMTSGTSRPLSVACASLSHCR